MKLTPNKFKLIKMAIKKTWKSHGDQETIKRCGSKSWEECFTEEMGYLIFWYDIVSTGSSSMVKIKL